MLDALTKGCATAYQGEATACVPYRANATPRHVRSTSVSLSQSISEDIFSTVSGPSCQEPDESQGLFGRNEAQKYGKTVE